MSGRRVEAAEALQLGLINRIVAEGQELTVALRIAEELAALPASGVIAVKRAFNRPFVEQYRRDLGDPQG